MAPDPNNFDDSGPKHIGGSSAKTIDWDNEEHCRCIAACLVKGTYVICGAEQERLLAPAWSENFHFRLREELVTDHNGVEFIFGAIYEPMPDAPRHPSAPHYIVAFRGTKLKHAKMAAKMQDLDDDFHILVNTLRDTKRYRRAREAVDELLNVNKDEANPDSSCVVWLAGHSLGAAVALELGRAMMLERVDDQRNLPTFLFNLPRVSLASLVDMLLRKDKRDALYAASNTVKVGVVSVLSDHQKRMEKIFERLARWVPNLYVHEKDPISNGLIGHFGRPQQLREWCCPDIVAKAGMQLSHRDMFSSLFGQEKMQPCLLPSVMLWINSSVDEQAGIWFDLRLAAHKLQQWWKPNSELEQAVNLFVQWFDQRSAAHELQQWWKPNSELSLSPRRHIFFEDMHGRIRDTDTVTPQFLKNPDTGIRA